MGRRVLLEVEVECGADGTPARFSRAGRVCSGLKTVESWRESGCWWDGEPVRTVFRVRDREGRVFELHRLGASLFPLEGTTERASRWLLYRIED
ncbi:MAG: hypothetical protein KatS3mg024_0211 [Armatimonadota bacterium]|nr:MAG: hypothetical protein KatS3mg024_0211 [Armatimonadota bacterium]